MIVVDASAVLDVLLRRSITLEIEERLFSPGESWHAPHIVDLEVAQVLRRHTTVGDMTPERGRQALDDLSALPLTRYRHDVLLPRIWELRHNATAYDAAYLALAEALAAPLVTRDVRLAGIPGHRAAIELL
jgi:predicted nucleic acid-binding protein